MKLANPSQLVLRSEALFAGRRVLLAGAPADALAKELPADAVSVWGWDAGAHAALQRQGIDSHFGVTPPAGPFDAALVFMPKAKLRLRAVLGQLAGVLAAGASVYLVGEKREGIDSAGKWLAAMADGAQKIDRARHCVLWAGRLQATARVQALQPDCRPLAVGDASLSVCTLPGVFSEGRLDEGTALLLQQLPLLPAGSVLDFGSGSGVISAFILRRQPALRLHAIDSDAFAVASTQATLQANGLVAEAYASDGLAGVREPRFATIVSNPPFHDGIRTDTRMATRFIRDMAQHLAPQGQLWLVANRFLPYAEVLAGEFASVTVAAETSRFVVYHARR